MKGYNEKPIGTVEIKADAPLPKPQKIAAAVAIGIVLGTAAVVYLEALILWVILVHLVKAKVAFLQVLGITLLAEYAFARLTMKGKTP